MPRSVSRARPGSRGMSLSQVSTIGELVKLELRRRQFSSILARRVVDGPVGKLLAKKFADDFYVWMHIYNSLIVKTVRVDRQAEPQGMVLDLNAQGSSLNAIVVEEMPTGVGSKVDVHLFSIPNVGGFITRAKIADYMGVLGLKPADPYSLAAVYRDHPRFVYGKPCRTDWEDRNKQHCYMAFEVREGGVHVIVEHEMDEIDDNWWFAGVPK